MMASHRAATTHNSSDIPHHKRAAEFHRGPDAVEDTRVEAEQGVGIQAVDALLRQYVGGDR